MTVAGIKPTIAEGEGHLVQTLDVVDGLQEKATSVNDTKRNWWSLTAPQIAMLAMAIGIALLCMSTIENGWNVEPLIWMSLVWYLAIRLSLGSFLFGSKSYSLTTLLVVMALVALIIMFPFTAIRKAHYRDSKRRAISKALFHSARTKVQNPFRWLRLETGEPVPECLAWRLPSDGITPFRNIVTSPKQLYSWPRWALAEATTVKINPWLDEPFLPSANWPSTSGDLRPLALVIGPDRLTDSQFRKTLRPDNLFRVENITQALNLSECESVTFRGCNLSESVSRQLIIPNHLVSLRLFDSSVEGIDAEARYPKLTGLSIVSVPEIDSKKFTRLVQNAPHLMFIECSQELVSNESFDAFHQLTQKSDTVSFTFCGSGGEMVWPENTRFSSRFSILMRDFVNLDFAGLAKKTNAEQLTSIEVYECRIRVDDFRAIADGSVKTRIEFDRCTISASDLKALSDELELAGIVDAQAKFVDWRALEKSMLHRFQSSVSLSRIEIVND